MMSASQFRPIRLISLFAGVGIVPFLVGAEAAPWFKSGFESGVELRYDEPTRAMDTLEGRDATTGFDWSRDVPAA
ncbi:MAG TPA: hypothetical protein VEA63_05765, partial [Opitutus sp.]|nr:hypothetical protein [Opitutus sp.]